MLQRKCLGCPHLHYRVAASSGYHHVLSWAVHIGCPWDARTCAAAAAAAVASSALHLFLQLERRGGCGAHLLT